MAFVAAKDVTQAVKNMYIHICLYIYTRVNIDMYIQVYIYIGRRAMGSSRFLKLKPKT